MAAETFIGIGSNLGHRFDHIQQALRFIAELAIGKLRTSIIFETKAILPPQAPKEWNLPYLNLVVSAIIPLSPHFLLKALKKIEKKLGRDLNAPRWSPRVIDLDILAWDEKIVSENKLQIPHPELMNRPFLVKQMALLQDNWQYPVSGLAYSHLTLAEILQKHIFFDTGETKCFVPFPQFVGIVNITPDSFSDGGKYFYPKEALQRIHELVSQGASVIDIGAQSTRPGAVQVSAEKEWNRLQPVLELLTEDLRYAKTKPKVSLDSFSPAVVKKALRHYPIDWINDVKGGQNTQLLKIVAETNCKIVINHSLTVPASKEIVLSFQSNPIDYIRDWAEKKVKELKTYGIDQNRIILDPGIGFGKTSLQSLHCLRKIDQLKQVGCEVLVGHSRKSFLNVIANTSNRDVETVGISHYLLKKSVNYLRVHNVETHQRSFTALALVEGSYDF